MRGTILTVQERRILFSPLSTLQHMDCMLCYEHVGCRTKVALLQREKNMTCSNDKL